MLHYAIGFIGRHKRKKNTVHSVSLMCCRCTLWIICHDYCNGSSKTIVSSVLCPPFSSHFSASLPFCSSHLYVCPTSKLVSRLKLHLNRKPNPIQTQYHTKPRHIYLFLNLKNIRHYLLTWWNRINSRTRSIWVWYLAVPEYNRWIIAETLPNILAYMRAKELNGKDKEWKWIST